MTYQPCHRHVLSMCRKHSLSYIPQVTHLVPILTQARNYPSWQNPKGLESNH